MERRTFVVGTGTLLATPLAAGAQATGKRHRVGFLQPYAPPAPWMDAFRAGLRGLGYVEGENLLIEWRNADGRAERNPAMIAELVGLNVDVIVTWSTPAALAAKQATRTIPIVAVSGDPVGTGLVQAIASPGGNVTGLAVLTGEMDPKQMELLKEAVPGLSRLAVLVNRENPALQVSLEGIERTARLLSLRVLLLEVRDAKELPGVFDRAVRERAGALLVLRDAVFTSNRRDIVALAERSRIPTMYGWREFVDAGGLMAYGVSFPYLWRLAAAYVDRILRGARPADLPIEQPMKFELVINMRTAKALGLTIPPAVLARADEVIQ
jgi:putative tryptophan/tyrosine transport system substrate-binding protein